MNHDQTFINGIGMEFVLIPAGSENQAMVKIMNAGKYWPSRNLMEL